jgi:hypothetical protein
MLELVAGGLVGTRGTANVCLSGERGVWREVVRGVGGRLVGMLRLGP